MYFAALALNMVLGLLVYMILTRSMAVESFGTYSFIVAVFLFSGVFFDFGLAPAGMRLMAMVEDKASFSLRAGALLMLSSGIGILFAVAVFGISFGIDAWWPHGEAGSILRLAAPLAAVYPLQEMVLSISQGSSRMKLMSGFLLLPRILLLALLLVLVWQGGIDVRTAVFATLMSLGAAIGIAISFMTPSFRGLGQEFKRIRREVREFGREVYAGRVVDGLTTGLDKLLLGFFHGMSPVGFYAIAMTMSTPIGMFSKAVSHSAYKRFVVEQRIPGRLLAATVAWSTLGALLLWAAAQVLVPLFFTDRYDEALTVLPWIAAGFGLAGLNHPFHSFLAAHRQGRAIRIMSISSSSVNIALNIVLIPILAMTGAAIAFVATYAVNIVMNLYFYRRTVGGGAAAPSEAFAHTEEDMRHG